MAAKTEISLFDQMGGEWYTFRVANSVHTAANTEISLFDQMRGEWYAFTFARPKYSCGATRNKYQKNANTKLRNISDVPRRRKLSHCAAAAQSW